MSGTELQETRDALVDLLGLGGQGYEFPGLDLLARADSRYLKDLRMNVKSVLEPDALDERQNALIGCAVAVALGNERLRVAFERIAASRGVADAEVAEAAACGSLLSVNNVLYRFRHFCGKEVYEKTPARVRMNIMARPVTGKALFELMSLVVSAVNGCEACVRSHEASVLAEGVSEAQVFEAVRLGSVLAGLSRMV